MVLQSGVRLGPYEIVAPIGAGGMGEVYRARDTRLKRNVAVKIIPERLAQDPTALNRFEREAQAVAALSHPNVLAIHDVGTEGDVSFVVMELLEGETLRECLRRSAVPWRKAVKYGVAIADGLAAAHAKGIIHRDLKPENIFLTSAGLVKILDFGLARMVPAGTNIPPEKQTDTPTMTLETQPGTVLGTVNYMSPEQISGRRTDPRTDIFSFGCVLYEMISGQRAFAGESIAETATAILRDEPPTLSDSRQDVPVELDRVITRCQEKKPDQRIQSARDLAFALRDLLTDSGPSKSVTLAGPRMRTKLGLQVVAAVMAMAVLIVALNVGGWRNRLFPKPQMGSIRSLAVMPLENLSGDPDQEYFADGMTGELITALGKIKALKVISRMSVMGYKDTDKSPAEIARELSVDALVEGTVTRIGNRVRIAANLIGASTSEQLWGASYERDLRDVLAMQGEIGRAIADQIQATLTPQEQARLGHPPSVNPEAYEAYLKGRFHWYKFSPEHLETSLEYFQLALEKDPNYALAYAGIADAWGARGALGVVPPHEAFPKVKAGVLKAIELDDTLAEGHDILARFRLYYEWDWPGAETEFKRAIELNPNYADVRLFYSDFLSSMRRPEEARAELERGLELDPFNFFSQGVFGVHLLHLRRYDDAIAQFRKTLRTEPNFRLAHEGLWFAFHQKRMDEEALAAAKGFYAALGDREVTEALSRGYAEAGYPRAMSLGAETLVTQAKHRYVQPTRIARLYAYAEQKDLALDWLEKAYVERDADMVHLRGGLLGVGLVWNTLRDEPRYKNLLRRIGLEPNPRPQSAAKLPLSQPRNGKIMLAVLPFDDMSPEPHEWFSDGMTEEMIGTLGRLNPDGLGVIARTSAMCYKNTGKGINEIGNELGVDYIVEGSVRRAGARLRISAKLIQVRDQTQLWSQAYDRMAEDVFAIQSEVAREVAAALAVRLLPERQVALSNAATADSTAHDAYLKGMFHWNKRTEAALHRAVEYFEAAIRADPNYARAHAALAMANVVLCGHKYVVPELAYKRMHASAERALALDDTLGEAHLVLAIYNSSARWDFLRAEREFQKAIELSPNHATARQWYAEYLSGRGRVTEALHHIAEARKLDPASRIISSSVAGIYYIAHRFDEAVARAREALSFDPEFAYAHFILGVSLAQQQMFDEATSELNKAVALGGDSSEYLSALAHVHALAGHTQKAEELLQALDRAGQTKYVPAYAIATVYAGLGRADEAFPYLNKAMDQKDLFLGWYFLSDPMMDPLRDDPRFDLLLRRIGFERDSRPQSRVGPRDGTIGPPVMPFENVNPDPQDWFGDGPAEERTARFGRLQPTTLELIAQRPATPHGHGVSKYSN